MPSKFPDYDYFTQEEWDRFQRPLIKIDPFLKEFAQKNGFYFIDSWSHDWPRRELGCRVRSKTGKYYLDKNIMFGLNSNKARIYGFTVGVLNHYGLKELYGLIPFLSKKRDSWKRLSWSKSLGEFKDNIDLERLKQLLEEAKQILDNFDESWLKDVKK